MKALLIRSFPSDGARAATLTSSSVGKANADPRTRAVAVRIILEAYIVATAILSKDLDKSNGV